jgi:hypothetical protein
MQYENFNTSHIFLSMIIADLDTQSVMHGAMKGQLYISNYQHI